MDFYPYHYSSDSDIRLCIFLSTSFCVGLPALVWASSLLHLHKKIRGRISAFIVLLLLSDLIQLLLSLYIVTQLLTKLYWISELFQFWSGLHWCGFQLHQLVALERVFTLKYPVFSEHFCLLRCYIIIFILVIVFSIPSALFFFKLPFVSTSILLFSVGTSLVPLSLLAVTNTIICKASFTPVSNRMSNTYSLSSVAFVTFVMLYLPFMLVVYASLFTVGEVHPSWYVMSVCLMSLRVISDPLLCVLVCRGNLRDVQTPQTHTEPNADETSV